MPTWLAMATASRSTAAAAMFVNASLSNTSLRSATPIARRISTPRSVHVARDWIHSATPATTGHAFSAAKA